MRKKVVSVMLFLGSVTVLSTGCSTPGSSSASISEKIIGLWSRRTPSGHLVEIEFSNNGQFGIRMESVENFWLGSYSISDGLIRIVDTYCGTRLPGVYRVEIKKEMLHFTAVDEPVCDRKKYLIDEAYNRILDKAHAPIIAQGAGGTTTAAPGIQPFQID